MVSSVTLLPMFCPDSPQPVPLLSFRIHFILHKTRRLTSKLTFVNVSKPSIPIGISSNYKTIFTASRYFNNYYPPDWVRETSHLVYLSRSSLIVDLKCIAAASLGLERTEETEWRTKRRKKGWGGPERDVAGRCGWFGMGPLKGAGNIWRHNSAVWGKTGARRRHVVQ